MPHISIETGAKMDTETKAKLAAGLQEAITAIPGKNASNLMIAIHDDVFMVFGDRESSRCLHMDVLMFKAAAKADKDALVAKCTVLFGEILGIEPGGVYITMAELENWGVGGVYK